MIAGILVISTMSLFAQAQPDDPAKLNPPRLRRMYAECGTKVQQATQTLWLPFGTITQRRVRIALVAVAVGVCAGEVVRSIFYTAVFNRSATQSEPVKSPVQPTSSDQAQDLAELNELKAEIWEAEVAQRNFAAGLPHCSELNGTNFYFSKQNRLLDLQDYRRSLDNLVTQGVFNRQDADARWAQVQKQATTDQANCTAVASLPSLRQKLKELQQRH